MTKINKLIENGILSFAKNPEGNPERLDYTKYTVSLIEHDYPAKTPVMWNAVYRKWGIDCGNIMLVGDTISIPEIFGVFRNDRQYLGGGMGVGFKDKALDVLDKMDVSAERIGSVNFVLKNEKRELVGYNTDGEGYAVSLEEIFNNRNEELLGKKMVMLGAGGTGKAIAFALARRGVKIVILNRTIESAKTLTESISKHLNIDDSALRFGGEEQIFKEVSDADVVLNVSTKGSSGALENYSPLASAKMPVTEENIKENLKEAKKILSVLHKDTIVSDIVLREKLTPFLESAQKAGFEILNGIPMVVNQGVEAVWLLHGNELESKGATKKEVYEVMKESAKF